MKLKLAIIGCTSLIVIAAHAQVSDGQKPRQVASIPAGAQDLGDWKRPMVEGRAPSAQAASPAPAPIEPTLTDIDVVDAHWMALTMWGEARDQGAEGMRAVGHVIANRWRLNGRYGAYVTDTVSQAWQFSCWNQGDPNREKMLNIDALSEGSGEQALWLEARQIADEILAGQSVDPTGGALFYHTTAVHPAWSRGVQPVAQIGDHLFFTTTA